MQSKQLFALCLAALVMCQALALPKVALQQQIAEASRKFEIDINTNSIASGNSGGFTWSNILSMLMQMLLGQNAAIASPSKNEIDDGVPSSPWTNILSVGLRVLTAFLSGPRQQVDGIDKVDNQSSSPMQFINIVSNLLDILKTSFSHRSLQVRSLGKNDTVSDAAVASISMLKAYMRPSRGIRSAR